MIEKLKNKKTHIATTLGAFAIVAALVLPSMASAQSTADLQAQIQALLKQIQALQEQLAQAQGGTAQWCHTFVTNLGVGASGDEVAALVTALHSDGIKVPEKADYYDETIASAVSAFQEKYRSEILDPAGLAAGTGYVGPKTRAKLNALYGCGKNPPSTPADQIQPTSQNARPSMSPQLSTVASCPQQSVSELQIADVAGVKSVYSPGEQISLSVKAMGLPGGSPASEACGFNVQAYIFDHQRTKTYVGVNGSYDSSTGLWSVAMSAPTNTSLAYDMEVFLYCGRAICGSDNATAPAQQVKIFSFTLAGGASGATPNPPVSVSEQVKCVFNNSATTQTCVASMYANKSCSDVNVCIVDLTGNYGDKIVWKSSCGGYAYTFMDGVNEYATFNCAITPPPPSPTPISTATTVPQNNPPYIAELSGTGLASNASSGTAITGQNSVYTVIASDSDSGDYVQYVTFDWKDGSSPTTFGPSNYNKVSVQASHTWLLTAGTADLTVTVKDTHGVTSQKSVSIAASGMIPQQATLYVQNIKGYDPATGVFSSWYANANKQLVLYGTFPASGNTVYIGDKKFSPISANINELWIQLDSQIPGSASYQIYVANGNAQSNTVSFYIAP